jgi:protein-S-isoprenylcysteine O-methyltransferase Ste14
MRLCRLLVARRIAWSIARHAGEPGFGRILHKGFREPARKAFVIRSMQGPAHANRYALLGLLYAWSAFAVMWAFWVCFVVFLASPRQLASVWPLPMVDRGGLFQLGPWQAALVDLALIAAFGMQHSVMARPWFKRKVAASMPPAFERCTYVHLANAALLALIVLWQPIPAEVWTVPAGPLKDAVSAAFAAGWIILFLGAWSFGIGDLLGLAQMRAWANGQAYRQDLKTGWLYRWLSHPMYVGVLLGVWATPRMSAGHLLLASGLTGYILIAMRYEERDLIAAYGGRYLAWRRARGATCSAAVKPAGAASTGRGYPASRGR